MSLLVTAVVVVWLVCAILIFIAFGIVTVIYSMPKRQPREPYDNILTKKTSSIT